MFKILGTGSCLPERAVTNDELSTFLDTSDEWITKRTGIRQRSVITHENLTQLASVAARQALEQSGVQPQELDLILCATLQGDYITPSLACMVQQQLGASCPAMDLNAACSGFLYALDVAAGYFARGRVRRVLVIAAEAMSRLVDWTDRSTCVLFGDGAGAVVLGEGEALRAIRLTAQGNAQPLCAAHQAGNCPFAPADHPGSFLQMDGGEVYKFAVSSMVRDVQDVVAEAGLSMEEIGHVVPHQANLRIIEAAAHRLHLPMERCLVGIGDMGNISAACIPILLDRANRAGTLVPGEWLVLTAFGAGFTSGACVLRWE